MLRFSGTPLKDGGVSWTFSEDPKDIEHGVTVSVHVRGENTERAHFRNLAEWLPKVGIHWLKPATLPPWGDWTWDLSACKRDSTFTRLKGLEWFEGQWTLNPEFEVVQKGSPISYMEAMVRFVVTKEELDHAPIRATRNPKKVFVIHGRNLDLRDSLFKLLKAVGLEPKEWREVVRETGKTLPYTLEVVEKGLETAGAVVALWSGDDIVRLHPDFTKAGDTHEKDAPQVRPNVIFETGLAVANDKDRNHVIIVKVGPSREVSDLKGVNYVNLNDTDKLDVEGREDLIDRLKRAGAAVQENLSGGWKRVGRFTGTSEVSPKKADLVANPPVPSPSVAPIRVVSVEIERWGMFSTSTCIKSLVIENTLDVPVWRIKFKASYSNHVGPIGSRHFSIGKETDYPPIFQPKSTVNFLSSLHVVKHKVPPGVRLLVHGQNQVEGEGTTIDLEVESFDIVKQKP